MSIASMIAKTGVTATVQSQTQTQGATGEVVKSWTTVYSNVPVRIQTSKVSQRNDNGDYIIAPFTIYMTNDYTILDDYRIVSGGVNYKIIRAMKDSSNHQWQIQAELFDS